MRISKSFLKTSAIYTIAGALPMASAVVLLPFYIKHLPTSVYGALVLYLAVSAAVQVVVMYSFDSSLYIHYHDFKNDKAKLSAFVSSAFIFMLGIGCVVTLVSLPLGDWLFRIIFKDPKISFYPFGIMAVAVGIFQGIFKVYSNLTQSRERPELFFWSNLLLFSLIAVFTIVGLLLFPNTLNGPMGGRVAAGLIATGWVLFRVFREFGVHFDFALLKSTFGYNRYTFIYQLLLWVVNYIDRFILAFYQSLAISGVYDFAVKCLVITELILNGLHSSFYPKVVGAVMAQEKKESTIEINRYYHGLTIVIIVLVCFSILLLPPLVGLLNDTKGYHEAAQYFPYLAVLYLIRPMRLYFGFPYGILKYTKPLPVIYVVISVVKIGAILLTAAYYGIYGVVLSTLASLVIETILLKVIIREKFTFKYSFAKMVGVPAVIAVLVLILEPLVPQTYNLQLHLGYVVVVAGLLVWVYRNELKTLDFKKMLR